MKLDNRGWGYRDMIIYSSVIIICLILVVVFCKVMHENIDISTLSSADSYKNVETKDSNSQIDDYSFYYEVENKMQKATFTYLQNYSETSKLHKIDLETLIGFSYINMVRDNEDGSICKGYVKIDTDTDQNYIVSPYLKCTSYMTNGYEE